LSEELRAMDVRECVILAGDSDQIAFEVEMG
jgi:hypothetical protein